MGDVLLGVRKLGAGQKFFQLLLRKHINSRIGEALHDSFLSGHRYENQIDKFSNILHNEPAL